MTDPQAKHDSLCRLAAGAAGTPEGDLAQVRAKELARKYALMPRAPDVAPVIIPTDCGTITVMVDGEDVTMPRYCAVCGDDFLAAPAGSPTFHTFWPHAEDFMCASCALSNPDNICSCSDEADLEWMDEQLDRECWY